jgi:hypothetical protein
MPRRSKPADLFVPLLSDERLHPGFKHLRTSGSEEPARLMINQVYQDFTDPDGDFAEQFQTAGFDARTFELYLYAYFRSSGYEIRRESPGPDFIVTGSGVSCAVEATTTNPTDGKKRTSDGIFDDLSPEALREKIYGELPIRFGSPLKSKLDKRYDGKPYRELEQCRDMPFVIAIEAFHDSQALFFTDAALIHYLYGLGADVSRDQEGRLIIKNIKILEHRYGHKVVPSNFFAQPDTENVSAVLFTNCGTYPKFGRMGYQAGYHRGNITMFRRGTCIHPDPNSATPAEFAYDLDFPPCEETWGQGLVVFHNPNARHPLPRYFFKDAAVHFIEHGRLCTEVPPLSLIPFASITIISYAEDDTDLAPDRPCRGRLRSMACSPSAQQI